MLHIIIGPMFAGKTTFLSNQLAKEKKSLYINHKIDNRGELFYSHDPNVSFTNIDCIKTCELTDNLVENYDVIGIDEAQFFKNLKSCVLHWVEDLKKTVYVVGLNCDYKRQKFGEIIDLVAVADSIEIIHSTCSGCNRNSLFSHRNSDEKDQISIGKNEYSPLCRSCFIKSV
jgi:thymidine kinase